MKMSRLVAKWMVVALVSWGALPAWTQEAGFEGGRIVRQDERGEELQLEANVGWGEEDLEGEEKLPWIPILSPTMICLDCWITKTLKIQDFYHQQAAEEYFAHSESCADLILCPDPCVGAALEYTLLAPIYAIRPNLLMRNCTCWGAGNAYGVPDPLPSVAVPSDQGPQVLTPPPSEMGASAPPTVSIQTSPLSAPVGGNPQVASTSKWASMSDQEILDHFGLGGSSAQPAATDPFNDASVAGAAWEFADQAPSTPARNLIATREASTPAQTPSLTAPASTSPEPVALEEAASEKSRKAFSVTDEEYERMQDIEKGLLDLDGLGR
ncbi:MAG: hypothetical protein GHCLOJNM_01493 [bacterium]|nr:hypothetical protein [bacterium]